ncbi:MAG: glycosyltransferase [Chloroherpetonaceae bacterium]|nr:glycosyltransferase [Chthonomonadaceae bacterium]MDW8208454.1 glycosyltransferase [Chloroherpetonaceae bacterium]
MNVLVGHTNRIPEVMTHRPLPGRENKPDQILAFGNGYAHVRHTPGMPWKTLLSCCPAGWSPDVYIHWSPEYNAVPEGLERAACLTVGVFGDWNLGGRAIHAVGELFDVLVADRNGTQLLRQKGFPHVLYAPLWAFDPQMHRRIPCERDLDIVMIGSFNHAVQWERARWLARVAKLSRYYRVVVTSGVYGEEYVRLLNRAKIVFNRSIRGELNMRTFEATACGALLFYERENPEIRDLFVDREECVLYGEEDLEDLLAYYLAPVNAAERERIAQAGWIKVQSHTYAHHFSALLDQIEPFVEAKRNGAMPPRRFTERPPEEQRLCRAHQWYLSCNHETYERMEQELRTGTDSVDAAHFRGVLLAERACHLPATPTRYTLFENAHQELLRALAADPDYTMARHNLGWLLYHMGRTNEGDAELRNVVQQLESPRLTSRQLRGPCFPREFDTCDVLIEQVWNHFCPGTDAWKDALRQVLLGQIYLKWTQACFQQADFEAAIRHAKQAVTCWPGNGAAQYHLARALRAAGRPEEALVAYQQAVAASPFLLEAWQEQIQLLIDLQRPGQAIEQLGDILAILDGSPYYAGARPAFDHLHATALQSQQRAKREPPITRWIAFADWSLPEDWQALLRGFAETSVPGDAPMLLLRIDPEHCLNGLQVLEQIRSFLTQSRELSETVLPRVTLICQPVAPQDQWKLYRLASAVIVTPRATGYHPDLARNAGVPVWTLQDMRQRHAA